MYMFGSGVENDFKESVKWYRKAAEQGNGYAQSSLGEMYGEGEGVPKDAVTGYAWHIIAQKMDFLCTPRSGKQLPRRQQLKN